MFWYLAVLLGLILFLCALLLRADRRHRSEEWRTTDPGDQPSRWAL